MQIDLLDPKAGKLLRNLEELNLIAIRSTSDDGFLKLVNNLREKAKKNTPTLDDITKEVELVRTKRYARTKE